MDKKNKGFEKGQEYLKRHSFLRRWISVMLVIALLITTGTLYAMNKAASAVTEEGAEEVGMVLSGDASGDGEDSSDFASYGLNADNSEETAEEGSSENDTSEDGLDYVEPSESEDTTEETTEETNTEEVTEEANSEAEDTDNGSENNSDESSENQDAENTSESENSSENGSQNESEAMDETNGEGTIADGTSKTDDEEDTEDEDKADKTGKEVKAKKEKTSGLGTNLNIQDVVLTVSYVNEDGELIVDGDGQPLAEQKKISLEDSINLSAENSEVKEIEGYTFKAAKLEGEIITKIEVKTEDASNISSNGSDEATENSDSEISEESEQNNTDSDTTETESTETESTESDSTETASSYKYYVVTLEDGNTLDIKEDKNIDFVYSGEGETKTKTVIVSDVKITAHYQYIDGTEIVPSKEVSTTDTLDLTSSENVEKLENCFFSKVQYEDKKIVAIKAVEKEITEDKVKEAIEKGNTKDSDAKETSDENVTDETKEEKAQESQETDEAASDSDSSNENDTQKSGRTVNVTEGDDGSIKIEEGSDNTYAAYELITADGETIELTEDADLQYIYHRANKETSFTLAGEKFTVIAVLSKPECLPEGIMLKVSEVTAKTEGYNYDAYLQAMNENAESIAEANGGEAQTYDENNTMLYDIAFVLDGVEYQPAEGTVSISFKMNEKQISEDFGVQNSEDVTVIHMPVSDEIRQSVDSTSEATQISSSDITVDVMKESNVELGNDADKIEFDTESFCIFAFTAPTTNSWVGKGLNENNNPAWIVDQLGDAAYFGIVADSFNGGGNIDYESNLAVNNLYDIANYTLYNYKNEINYSDRELYKVKIIKKSNKAGTFNVGLFSDDSEESQPTHVIPIETKSDGQGSYIGEFSLDKIANGRLHEYVYEVYEVYDAQGNKKWKKVKDGEEFQQGEELYTVSYAETSFGSNEKGNDLLSILGSNFVTGWGADVSDSELALKLEENCSVYLKNGGNGYIKATRHGSKIDRKEIAGSFPINVSSMLNDVAALSSQLAEVICTDDIEVANIKSTTGDYFQDFKMASGSSADQNDAIKTALNVEGSKLLVINLDLTNYREYKLGDRGFFINGKTTDQFDWNELCSRVIINPVQKNGDRYEPYTGTLEITNGIGTLIAPKATVKERMHYGAIIAKNLYHTTGEIHKMTLLRYKSFEMNVTITNTASNDDNTLVINAEKYVNDAPATADLEGRFKFTLQLLDPQKIRGWITLTDQITNTKKADDQDHASEISYTIHPGLIGMQYGGVIDKNDNANQLEHTYFFRLTENDISGEGFEKDKTGILIKIKYYNEPEILYYRVTQAELDLMSNYPRTNEYNDQHRISSNGTDKLHNTVAFFNVSGETVDLEVTKAWVLNGRNADVIPSKDSNEEGKKVAFTLYADGVPVDAAKYPVTVTEGVATDVANAHTAWLYKWTKLPRYDSSHNEIRYTVAETSIPTGFSSSAADTKRAEIKYVNENYVNEETGSTRRGTATVINTANSLRLTLYKYEDNKLATNKYKFMFRLTGETVGNNWYTAGSTQDITLYNESDGTIVYDIDPALWNMQVGHNYYFRIHEPENNTKTEFNYTDKGIVIARVAYNSDSDIKVNYYRIDESEKSDKVPEWNYNKSISKYIIEDYGKIAEFYTEIFTDKYEVTDKKAAFYNSSTGKITISVVKYWDELVGQAKNEKMVADSIFDVKVKLLKSKDGASWDIAGEETIKAPRIYQTTSGSDFSVEDMGDYEEKWTYQSKPKEFKNLSANYKYKVQEWYGDTMLGEAEITTGTTEQKVTLNGATVNGFKLEDVTSKADDKGNVNVKLHNTPYIQLRKYWKASGSLISNEEANQLGFGPVYVKLYRNYRANKTYVQVGADLLTKGDRDLVNPNNGVITLDAAHDWSAEFALDRKQDNAPGQAHVYQYVYMMVECDKDGNDLPESASITYGSINTGNVSRTTADVDWNRGFKDKTKSELTKWDDAWVSGNNYPVCILTVTNNRDTYVLPNSGSIGTTPFALGGLGLIGIALIYAVFGYMWKHRQVHDEYDK
ncbi:Cna B-type domain-containing protein [Butyrivibrio sp. AE3004]|uniref:Cna B-type domain-containing protein n=1 Tax=Butyrivibrio sp. AE3004 TaxID=1506994 RepID=UPI000494944C|nr:Cna B-type domain-containing protein [Butyrivibrio sp. AE3004]